MELGAFSISLAVRDIAASRDFYEKFGFRATGGDASKGWLILKNGPHIIGLFQGMFEKNILTFNPGWAATGDHPKTFTDVREIQAMLDGRKVKITTRAEDSADGPASLIVVDPDGNPILIDQHVPRPE